MPVEVAAESMDAPPGVEAGMTGVVVVQVACLAIDVAVVVVAAAAAAVVDVAAGSTPLAATAQARKTVAVGPASGAASGATKAAASGAAKAAAKAAAATRT